MSSTSGLGHWLRTLRPEQLRALLARRPDAAVAPEPRDLGELATRLGREPSIARAAEELSTPALQVAQALLVLDRAADRAELLAVLGVADELTAGRVDQAVEELFGLALAYPAGGRVRLPGAWANVLPEPLALGRSGLQLYHRLTVAQLSRIGSGLGLGGYADKQGWVRALTAAVGDPGSVARRLAQARPDIAELVRRLAWDGPRLAGVRFPDATQRVRADDLGAQLAVQGWFVPTEWGVGEMPRELALAVRGPGFHAPFDPEPPPLATADVPGPRLREAGRHAAGAAVEAVRRVLALLDAEPPATLKDGGVGVRELRRVAKRLGTDEAAVRQWLETAAEAGLAAAAGGAVLATTDAEAWLTADPAAALARLLLAWWRLPTVPSHQLDEDGKGLPALRYRFGFGRDAMVRDAALILLAELPRDRGVVDPDELAGRLEYRHPIAAAGPDLLPRLRATLAEAGRFGLVADGALTPLGYDLLGAVAADDPGTTLTGALAGLLPEHTSRATFLPDLTVVVAGRAAVALSRLLDAVATAESRDTASTWRFTPDTVRAALDAGRTADGLLAELAAVADNPLPQPLEYLVRDVARRHGQVQVFAVASCIRVADAALAAELLAHRGLASLTLRALADTVLASSAPTATTVAALRKAGYAPIRQDARGETVVEKAPVRRVDRRRTHPTALGHGRAPTDLAALAARLSVGFT